MTIAGFERGRSLAVFSVFDGCATEPCHKHGFCNRERNEGHNIFTCRCSAGFSGPCCEKGELTCG